MLMPLDKVIIVVVFKMRAVLELNQHQAHQCQLKPPWLGGAPGDNTYVFIPCLKCGAFTFTDGVGMLLVRL
jgi:hypothetical protein